MFALHVHVFGAKKNRLTNYKLNHVVEKPPEIQNELNIIFFEL